MHFAAHFWQPFSEFQFMRRALLGLSLIHI